MRGVFLDLGTVHDGDLDMTALESALPGLVVHDRTSSAEVAARIAGFDVIMTNKCRITRDAMASGGPPKLIALTATGVDNVDIAAARELRIAVTNLHDYCTQSVAQHVFALLLALNHQLREYAALVRRGDWGRAGAFSVSRYPIRELAGRQLVVVGLGTLGRAVARLGEAFGMQVAVANRPGGGAVPGRRDLDELLPAADVLTLHCPLTAATRGLIGARRLALMRPDAILINTARGGLVDAAALAAALREGRLGGAGIDVLDGEPPAPDHPLLQPDIPNLILTPHVAWAAQEARQRCLDELARNIRAFQKGEHRNRVV